MNVRRVGQVGVDAGLVALAYYLAYVLRFDAGHPARATRTCSGTRSCFVVAMKLVVFALFGLYSKLWRFVDQKDFEAIVKAVVVATVGADRRRSSCSRSARTDPPRGVIALDFLLTLAFVTRRALPGARRGRAPAARPAARARRRARC